MLRDSLVFCGTWAGRVKGSQSLFQVFFAVGAVTFSGFPKSQWEWLPQLEHATVLSISKLIYQFIFRVLLEVILEANKCA